MEYLGFYLDRTGIDNNLEEAEEKYKYELLWWIIDDEKKSITQRKEKFVKPDVSLFGNFISGAWRDCSVINNTSFSSRAPEFNTKHPQEAHSCP